jgi:hypothetical protein
MNEEFINMYVEKMSEKISELCKSEIMLQTRLAISEKIIANLFEEKSKLEATISTLSKKSSKLDKNAVKEESKEDNF